MTGDKKLASLFILKPITQIIVREAILEKNRCCQKELIK
jgi:hypothetical protein